MANETQTVRLEQPGGSTKQTDTKDLHLDYSINQPEVQARYAQILAAAMQGGVVPDDLPDPWRQVYDDAQTDIANNTHPVAAYEQAVRQHFDGQADDIWAAVVQLINGDSQDAPIVSGNSWHFYTLADAYEPRKPLQYAVDGLFALPSLNIGYGPPGCLKSLLLEDTAISVASGERWLPPLSDKTCRSFNVTQGPVVWADFDNGLRRTHERFDALGKARQLPVDTPLHYVSMPDPWLEANKADHVDALIERVLSLRAEMVVIDNLGTVSGGLDENSPQMIQVMSNLRRLAETTGTAVVVIHHQRKGSGSSDSRKGDSLRGHSSIEAALDLALRIEREEESPFVVAVPTKVRGPDIHPFGAYFTYEHHPGTQDLSAARFWGYKVVVPGSYQQILDELTERLQDGPQPKTELTKSVAANLDKVSQKKARDVVERCVREGKLREQEEQEGRKRTKFISLVEE